MRYDINASFEENKKNGPYDRDTIKDRNATIEEILGEYGIETNFFGYKTKLPLGVAAGPLFNEKYMKAAAMDGFTVITWKTFRSEERLAHRNNGDFLGHNVVYLDQNTPFSEKDMGKTLTWTLENKHTNNHITITNSFGMGSDEPDIWTPQVSDIEIRMKQHNKTTIASVVASPKEWRSQEQLAADYTNTALKAEAAGAKIIEFNLSCPNVGCSAEWSIYKNPASTAYICSYAKERLKPETKLLIKIGYNDKEGYHKLLTPVLPYIDGVVAINTIPMKVVDQEGKQALPWWLTTWTCGYAINKLATQAVHYIHELRNENNRDIMLVGCGWVMSAKAFMRHIDAGADFVMCATAAWFNPDLPSHVAQHIRDNKISR